MRARHLRDLMLRLAHRRHRQQLARVIGRGMAIAIQSLQPFRVRKRSRESHRNIGRDMVTTDGKLRGMQHLAFEKHRHGGGAAAHVDHRGAKLAFIAHQSGQPRGVRGGHQSGDIQLAAGQTSRQCAQGRAAAIHNMQLRRQRVAEQPPRVGNTRRFVSGEAERQRMDREPSLRRGTGTRLTHHAADIVRVHRTAIDGPLHVEQARFRLATGEIYIDGFKPQIRHVLRLADSSTNRALSLVEIDNAAGFDAPAFLPAEAQSAQPAVGFRAADEAGDLGGADIQHTERAGFDVAATQRFFRRRLYGPAIQNGRTARHAVHCPSCRLSGLFFVFGGAMT